MSTTNTRDIFKTPLRLKYDNIPQDYKPRDIILKHYNGDHGNKSCGEEISARKINKLSHQLKQINIVPNKNACILSFSSIFYFIKRSRHIFTKEMQLTQKGIYPSFISRNIKKIDLITSNCNDKLITLHSIGSNITKYLFSFDNSVFISFKDATMNKEYLLKIAHISNVKLINKSSTTEGDATDEKDKEECELIIELNKNMELFEYFHRTDHWICDRCSAVNRIKYDDIKEYDDDNLSELKDILKCVSCDVNIDENNAWFWYKTCEYLNIEGLDLKENKVKFVDQRVFYRKCSSFDGVAANSLVYLSLFSLTLSV